MRSLVVSCVPTKRLAAGLCSCNDSTAKRPFSEKHVDVKRDLNKLGTLVI